MLIRNSTEYVLGEPSSRELSKLVGRREDYSFFGSLLRSLIGAVPGFICLLVGVYVFDNFALIMIGGMGCVVGGILAITQWPGGPIARRNYAYEQEREGRLIMSAHPLFGLIMTEWVTMALQQEKKDGKTQVKQAVDAFLKFSQPYCRSYGVERSELLTLEWEKEHGRLCDHPMLVAIDDAATRVFYGNWRGSVPLRSHVRETVRAYRVKRLAMLQNEQIASEKNADRIRQEISYLQSALLTRR